MSSDPVAAAKRREWLIVLAVVVVLKALAFLADPQFRFFMWDSVTYLKGALDSVWPRDRSILYSLLIRASIVPTHSVTMLVVTQTLAGIVSAMLVFYIGRKQLELPFGSMVAVCALMAIEPGQLFYERMMMAEAFGAVPWLTFVALSLAYFRAPDWRLLPLLAIAGIFAVSLRLNGTIIAMLVGGGMPLWRALLRRRDPAEQRVRGHALVGHLAVAVLATGSLHLGYQHLVGWLTDSPPGYIGVMGVFRLGTVAPLIQPEDFDGTGCAATVIADDKLDLSDPTTREGQLWNSHGLWAAMKKECPEPEKAADLVSERAMHRGWWKIPLMGFPTVAQYFDIPEAKWRMNSDLGHKELPMEIITPMREQFGIEVGGVPFDETPVFRWFEHSRWWYVLCFFSLLPLGIAALRRGRHSSNAAISGFALIALWVFSVQFFLSHIISFRYLHPFPPLVLLAVALVWAGKLKSERT